MADNTDFELGYQAQMFICYYAPLFEGMNQAPQPMFIDKLLGLPECQLNGAWLCPLEPLYSLHFIVMKTTYLNHRTMKL
jgi:hypothetical protein